VPLSFFKEVLGFNGVTFYFFRVPRLFPLHNSFDASRLLIFFAGSSKTVLPVLLALSGGVSE